MDAQINPGGNHFFPLFRRLAGRVLRIAALVLAILITAGGIGVALLRYGPFDTTRQFIIGSAMSSFTHQYIAKWLFTEAEIKQVTDKNSTSSATQKQDLSAVNPTGTTDSSIVLSTIGDGLQGYALEIKNPLRVHVACTAYIGKRGEFVSTLAEKNNAVAAINGGGFSTGEDTTGTGAIPSDFVFSNGKLLWKDSTLDTDELPKADSDQVNVVALNSKGVLIVGNYTIGQLQSMDVSEAVDLHDYKPLVIDGKAQYTNDGGKGVQPRTAIGQKKDGTIVLVVIDGRQAGTSGARLNQLADLLVNQYDCWTAANLDGGASTAMYYRGNIINKPSAIFGERTVATAFYVSK